MPMRENCCPHGHEHVEIPEGVNAQLAHAENAHLVPRPDVFKGMKGAQNQLTEYKDR